MSAFTDKLLELLENNQYDELDSLIQNSTLQMEPYFINMIPQLLNKFTDFKTCEYAKKTGNIIIEKMNPFSMKIYMDILYESMNSLKWQIKKGSLMLLGLLAKHQQEVVKYNLPNMILRLIDMTSDVKDQVKKQTRLCFEELCSVIDNVDIIKIIPHVINAYMEPVKYTEDALDKLVATSFINEVDMSTLGLLVPILTKGMREKKVAIKTSRRHLLLVICVNCVNDPRTASYFLSDS